MVSCHSDVEAYLSVIRLVKSENVDAILVVPKGTGAGQDVEKTFHSDMPICIREVLNEFKCVFPMDLTPKIASNAKRP